jgi:hypothetical protein
MKGQNDNRYPNGYLPKIQFWANRLNEVMNTETPDLAQIDHIHRKLDFFIQKEWDRTMSARYR